MSYDYLICRLPEGTPQNPVFEDVEPTTPIGSLGNVKDVIASIFPSVRWKERNLPPPLGHVVMGVGGPPEFQFSPGADGVVTNIMMSRASAAEVRSLLRAIGCVALDLQAETVIVAAG